MDCYIIQDSKVHCLCVRPSSDCLCCDSTGFSDLVVCQFVYWFPTVDGESVQQGCVWCWLSFGCWCACAFAFVCFASCEDAPVTSAAVAVGADCAMLFCFNLGSHVSPVWCFSVVLRLALTMLDTAVVLAALLTGWLGVILEC
jgi:hypothetical protein